MKTNNGKMTLPELSADTPAAASLYTDALCGLTDVAGMTAGLDENGCPEKIYYDDTVNTRVFIRKNGRLVPAEKHKHIAFMKFTGAKNGKSVKSEIKKAVTVAEFMRCFSLAGVTEDNEKYRIVKRALAGFAAVYYTVNEDGDTTATASVLCRNEKYAVIGNVYTVGSERGRGLASALTEKCAGDILAAGLIPALYCLPEMKGFYSRLGFTEDDDG